MSEVKLTTNPRLLTPAAAAFCWATVTDPEYLADLAAHGPLSAPVRPRPHRCPHSQV